MGNLGDKEPDDLRRDIAARFRVIAALVDRDARQPVPWTVRRVLRDAAASFVYWTLLLTPWMLLVVGLSPDQYLGWVGMQAIIVPPLGVLYTALARRYLP